MKITRNNLILSSIVILASALVIFSVVKAGSLTPPGSAFFSGSPAGTMNTFSSIHGSLKQKWQSDPNLGLCWSNGSADGYAGPEKSNCSINNGLLDTSGYANVHYWGLWATGSYNQYDEVKDSNFLYWICLSSGGCSDAPSNSSSDWTQIHPAGAVEYCQYLDQNGTVVDSTPQNYWHLPTEAELMAELENEYLPGGAGFTPSYIPPGGFQGYGYYWSSSAYSSSNAWSAYNYFNGAVSSNNFVYSHLSHKDSQHLVRCVH